MRMVQRLLIGASLVVVAAGLGPVATATADPSPVINWANSASDDLGRIQVSVTAPNAVTSLKVQVMSPGTGPRVALLTAFRLASGTAQDGVWAATQLVHLDTLGSYDLTVTATDATGDSVTANRVGTLAYYVRGSFTTFAVSPAQASYAHRTLTLRGRLMGRWPGGGPTKPLVGYVVHASQYQASDETLATTNSAGRFAMPITVAAQPDWVNAYVPYDSEAHPGVLSSSSPQLNLTIVPSATRVTAHLSRTSINIGDAVTVSGTLSWKSPTGWRPRGDATLNMFECTSADDCPDFSGTAKTDAAGHYTFTFTPSQTLSAVQVGYPSDDPYVASVQLKTGPLSVLQVSTFADFSAARDDAGAVVIQGIVAFPGTFTPVGVVVKVQYAKASGDPWRTVSTVDATQDGLAFSFSARAEQPAAGYWRAVYAGDPMNFQPAISPVVAVP